MKRRLTTAGFFLTVFWIFLAAAYAWSRPSSLLNLDPNELGDFLAGLFSPLAFLWLILGYMQQGEELRLSSEALQLQAEELKNSVDQQRDLVSATREQILLERELAERMREERMLASLPRFTIGGGGNSPSHDNKPSFRRYYIAVTNTGAPVTGVSITAVGWGKHGERVAHFPILDRGATQKFELEMPIAAWSARVEVSVQYTDSHGFDRSTHLVSPGGLDFRPHEA